MLLSVVLREGRKERREKAEGWCLYIDDSANQRFLQNMGLGLPYNSCDNVFWPTVFAHNPQPKPTPAVALSPIIVRSGVFFPFLFVSESRFFFFGVFVDPFPEEEISDYNTQHMVRLFEFLR